MSDVTQHNIETIQDLVDLVTAENIENLRNDLGDFLSHVLITKTMATAAGITSLPTVKLLWTDDSKRESKMIIRGKEKDNYIEIKSKPRS